MRGTELARESQFCLVPIERDDRIGVYQIGALHDIEADAADAEHGDRLAWQQPSIVEDDAETGRDGAAQQRQHVAARAVRHRGQPVLRGNRIVAERRDPACAQHLPFVVEARRWRVDAATLYPVHHHPIARLDLFDARADVDNLATALVPKEVREVPVFTLSPGDLVDLLATDPAVLDLDEDLTDIEFRHFELVNFERRVLPDQYCCLHSKPYSK